MKIFKLTEKEKLVLLDFLGYRVEEGVIISNQKNEPEICPYTKEVLMLDKVSIMPGSTILFNTNALTIAQYFSEHVDEEKAECPGMK